MKEDSGIRFPAGLVGCLYGETSNPDMEPKHLPLQHILEDIFVNIKWPEQEADNLRFSSTDVINTW